MHSLRKSIFFLDPEFTDLNKVPQKREAFFSVSQGFYILTVWTQELYELKNFLFGVNTYFMVNHTLTTFLKNGSQFFYWDQNSLNYIYFR